VIRDEGAEDALGGESYHFSPLPQTSQGARGVFRGGSVSKWDIEISKGGTFESKPGSICIDDGAA